LDAADKEKARDKVGLFSLFPSATPATTETEIEKGHEESRESHVQTSPEELKSEKKDEYEPDRIACVPVAELSKSEKEDLWKIAGFVNFNTTYSSNKYVPHKTVEEVAKLISESVENEVDPRRPILSQFIQNKHYRLVDLFFDYSKGVLFLQVTHPYLHKLSDTEFEEYVFFLNLYFLQKFDLKPTNLRVQICSRNDPFQKHSLYPLEHTTVEKIRRDYPFLVNPPSASTIPNGFTMVRTNSHQYFCADDEGFLIRFEMTQHRPEYENISKTYQEDSEVEFFVKKDNRYCSYRRSNYW